jgi:hypothetical protein
MLPTYSFLPRIAHQLTNTVRVSNVLRFGELAALSEDQLLTIFADLLEFNSVEHYQLLQSLCRFSPGTLKEFVMDVYSAYFIRQNWVLRRLMSCLPEASVNALGGGAHRIATNAQNATMPTQAFRDSLSLAHEITTFISSRRDSLPQGEANVEMVAQAVVDEVVLRRRLLGPAGDTGQDSANLDWAESRLPESTEVGALRLELASSWLSQTNYTWQRRVETSVNNSVHPLVITGTTQVGGRLGNALTFVSASSIKGLTQAARLGDKVAIKSPTYDWRLAGTFPGDQGVLVDSVFEELITPAEQASNIIASTEGIRRVDDGYFGDVDSTYAGEQLGLTNVINPSGSLHFELSGGQLSKYTLKLRGTILGSNGGLDEIGKTMTVNILEGSTNLKLPKAAYMKLAE